MSISKVCMQLAGAGLSAVAATVWALPPVSPCPVPTPTCYTVTGSVAGPNGTLSAQAIFQINGSNELVITLSNTAAADVLVPAEILTGIGFTLDGVTLTPVSAKLSNGSTVVYDPDGQPAGGVVGGEWAYASGIDFHGAEEGISSAGLGLFGNANFPGADLSSPQAVNGLNYGILSVGDNTATGNSGVTGSGGQVKDTVKFKLAMSGTVSDLPGALSDVVFQWGTALNEPHTNTPIPGTAALLGLGALGFVVFRRRRTV